ncbi:hypothetical protein FB45DRAFT_901475 [Roridomyces roridus]|uniref:F-box domain-containing protein n=1 Tax=Roridomyces roridus TaxID=1738132 RepID=A0AAD7FWS3_9AGAR|nr:hypothetical protein FB45DRAFT_901475 [Roridomyces roridus]
MPPSASLDRLPVELWLACFSLCSIRQLRRLCSVCRTFREICFPLSIQHQSIDLRVLRRGIERANWIQRTQQLHRAAVRLDRLGNNADSVRSLRFVACGPDFQPLSQVYPYIRHISQFDTLCARIDSTFIRTLPLYRNLRTLHITQLRIDGPVQGVLRSLPVLEDLTLSGCPILSWDGEPLRLRAFGIEGEPRPGPWDTAPLPLVAADTLQRLHMNHSSQSMAIILGFGATPLPQLTHLSLEVVCEGILSFLYHCPNVESLQIAAHAAPSSIPSHIPSSFLPALREFIGPREVLRAFISNRPVHAVTLVGKRPGLGGHPDMSPTDLSLALDDISSTSVPLQSLSLPRSTAPTVDVLADISVRFPELRELRLTLVKKYGGAGLRMFPGPPDKSLDTREPVLDDETAFDGIGTADDDMSDSEEPTLVVPSITAKQSEPGPLHTILDWIVSRTICLPSTLEILTLQLAGLSPAYALSNTIASMDAGTISPGDAHQFLTALSRLYPLLRELHVGYVDEEPWVRETLGVVWRKRNLYVRMDG